jgi:hypothetical protein
MLSRNERLTQEHHISRIHSSSEELGPLVNEFQVILLAAIFGNSGAKLEVDGHACSSNDTARNPEEKSQSNAARKLQDTTRSCKDTRSNHTIEHKERRRDNTDLTLVRSRSGMFAVDYI